jgi:hypothetical protein
MGQNPPATSPAQDPSVGKRTDKTSAPTPADLKAKAPSYHVTGDAKMWMENAEVLTAETLQDGKAHLGSSQMAVLEARLAVRWQATDPTKARKWLDSAAERVMHAPMNEPADESIRRLYAALNVAQCATLSDQPLTDRILNSAIDQIGEVAKTATKEEKLRLFTLMHRLSIFTVSGEKNPGVERDAKIARALIRIGTPETYNAILQPMETVYWRNASLGDSLLSEMLDRVEKKQLPLEAMWSMSNILFPNQSYPEAPKVNEELRQRYLAIVYNDAMKMQTGESEGESCKTVSPFSFLITHYPPEQQAQLRTAIEGCKPQLDGDYKKQADDGLKGLTTSDDFLKAADETSNMNERAEYKIRAAAFLMNSNPDKGLAILDGMTAEECKSPMYDTTLREQIEMNAAMAAVQSKDYNKLQSLIDRSPNPGQTALHIASSAATRGDEAYATSLLPVIRKLLGHDAQDLDVYYYSELVTVFAKLARPEAPAVMQEALKVMESEPEFLPSEARSDDVKEGEIRYMSFWADLRPAPFPDLLDVMDQRLMRAQIEQMKYAGERASMRLWLLRGELKAYEDALKAEKMPKKSMEAKNPASLKGAGESQK